MDSISAVVFDAVGDIITFTGVIFIALLLFFVTIPITNIVGQIVLGIICGIAVLISLIEILVDVLVLIIEFKLISSGEESTE